MLKTIFVVFWTVMVTIVFGTTVIVVAFFSKTGNMPHKIAVLWARSILFASRVKVGIKGLSNIEQEKPYVFMANHQSNFDILALFVALPVQFRWLAKAELFKIPIFAQGMRGCGYISIERTNRESAFESIKKAAEKIKSGTSLMIFPEGTRSMDGRLLPFKKGGFVLAVDSGVPIVPIIIRGSHSIMPKKKMKIKAGNISLEVLQPVETSSYNRGNKDDLVKAVRSIIEAALEKTKEETNEC